MIFEVLVVFILAYCIITYINQINKDVPINLSLVIYAVRMDPGKIFQIITNSTLLATRLLSGTGRSLLEFTQHRYCAVLREDAPTSSDVIAVVANHKDGATVRYSITGGNRDGLFTIDQKTGLITLAAALDYELYDKHELVVSGEGGGQVVHTIVQVSVADVNDNPPVFLNPDPHVTVIEEDDRHLPTTLIKVDAKDPDLSDEYGLLYTLQGDGVDGYSAEDAFFSINPRTGDLMQLRALDRDPPNGKRIWKLRVKVQDGHDPWKGGKRPKGTKNTSMKSSDQSPPWDYENGFQNDQPVGDTLETDYDISELATQIHEVPEQQKYISFKWDSLKTQEDEIKSRLWEAKDNGYDKLVSLQNGGGSTRKNAWTLERSRKYKGRSLFWANSNDRSHSWKFKEIGNKDTKRLSWNDQTRFGIPKSVYNYKNEDNSHKNSWELSKRVRDEKINDRLVSRPETKISNSEELDEATDWGISNRISNIGDHTWHVNRLRESLGDSTGKRTSEGKRSKVENKASQEVIQKQGMKEKISSSKARPGELRVASRTAPSIGNQAQMLDQSMKILTPSSNATMVANDKEGEPTGDKGKLKNFRKTENGGNPENTDSKRNFQNCNSSCKGDNSRSDYIPDTQNEKQVRQTSQSSWSSSLKTRIKLSNVKKQSEIVTHSDSTPYYLISVDKFQVPHVPRNTNFKDATSNWKEMKNSDNDQFTQETKSGIKTKRSSDELLKRKQRVSKEELETSSSTRVHYLKSKQRSLDQLKLDPHNSLEKDNIERVSQQSTRSLESRSWKQVSVNDETKRKPTDSLIQKNGDSSVREVSTYNTPHPIESIASFSKLGEYSENLKTLFLEAVLNEPIVSSKLSNRQIEGSTSRASSNKVSNKMGDVVKYSDIDSTYVLNQHSNSKFLSDSRLKGDSFVPQIKNFLPALAAQNRQIRSSNKNYKFGVKKPESKWVLKRPKGKGWLSRGARDTLFDSHFDNFDLDEEECYESLPDDAGIHKKAPVHEVEMMVTVIVKDINDNAPIFPNVTMFGDVQENGPVDLSVAEVSAWDADDATEGTNARITYAIEKNVIHDKSGEAIFNVDPNSGLVTTALCCLDRETTPEYHIQVVAADGGGLKGTGTVVVRLTDENDNSPRLARQYWELEVDETWGDGPPDNLTLLEMTAADPDTKNHFSYKIVEESGWGWDHFGIRSTGASGQLYALKKLDFEDDTHRQGFKFMVQVTDRGDGGWVDPRHQDTAWVGVRLRDLNDNPPQFVRPHAHVTISEDAPPGTLLTTVSAHDPDVGGAGQVDYEVVGGWNSLRVDTNGEVTLSRQLDREADDGTTGIAKILGVDRGEPPLTATATLTITVTDVNDCSPRLLPPDVLHVTEGDPPVLLGVLTATDDDIWALGHGPPFSLSLSPSNPPYVMDLVRLKFDQHVDSGRGGAELWTRGSLDRETHRTLPVDVVIVDAGGLNRTQTVTIVVNDLNDNPMKPAAKTVYLWKTQGSGSDAPLGRVYVDDPDDWDISDKTFRWAGKPHPLFTLNADDGTIFASSQVREGRYLLHFAVSDRVWSQVGVAANVTVVVRTLTHDALTHAAPVILIPTTPADLTRGWTPTSGGGGLGKLLQAVHDIISEGPSYKVEVVSVYGNYAPPGITSTVLSTTSKSEPSTDNEQDGEVLLGGNPSIEQAAPTACVWVSVKDEKDEFIDPIRLQGLLSLHKEKLEKATGLSVSLKDPPPVFDKKRPSVHQTPKKDTVSKGYSPKLEGPEPEDSALSTLKLSYEDGASVTSLASTALPLQVVDTNITSLVTPLLIRTHECVSHETPRGHSYTSYDSDTCTPSNCLNGGKCVRFPSGSRCVCPGGSLGPQCKILSRTFSGSGWGWVKPLPPCLPTTLSLRVLTRRPDGLLIYSGPLVPHSQLFGESYWNFQSPMLALQVIQNKPELIVEGIGSSFALKVNASITDGEWHTIHLHLHSQGAVMMVDFCGLGWDENTTDDSHCVARKSWGLPEGLRSWEILGPLQLGGLAQGPQRPEDYGWSRAPTPYSLDGCLSDLTINGQLLDLGEPACSKDSTAGCHSQEAACSGGPGACGIRGACLGGLNTPECHCDPGWTGASCDTRTVPATLGSKSYMKLALSFIPSSRVVSVQLRVRTLGETTGMLVRLAAQHTQHTFTVHLRAGVACASVSGAGWTARVACVEGRPIGDGQWHTIKAERHGHNLLISVDGGGNEWRLNKSLPSLMPEKPSWQEELTGPPMPLEIDKHDGVTVGGLPEFLGVKLVTVGEDLQDTCIDDLRVSDRQLPLPPAVNGSTWGQVTTLDGLIKGCNPPNSCVNTTCDPPLSCHPSWTQPSCSCGPGQHLLGSMCEDVDECLLEPCLHRGTCYNMKPDYLCVCGPNHMGDNCEWTKVSSAGHPLTAPAAIAAVTLSLLFLVLIGFCISLRHHRLRTARALGRQETEESADKDSIIAVKIGCKGSVMTLDPEKKETFLGLRRGWKGKEAKAATTTKTKGPEDESHTTFLELLKLSRAKPAKENKEGNTVTSSGVSAAVITSAVVSRSKDIALVVPTDHQHHHLPGEDLRNYAYEGDGSSSGSLTSTISGLRAELEREEPGKVIASEFVEVMDLLKNLPEAPKSSILLARLREKRTLAKEVGDPEVISTVSLGSLRRRESTTKDHCKTSSSPPSTVSFGSFPRPSKERKSVEMRSSKGVQLVCSKDELTTAC